MRKTEKSGGVQTAAIALSAFLLVVLGSPVMPTASAADEGSPAGKPCVAPGEPPSGAGDSDATPASVVEELEQVRNADLGRSDRRRNINTTLEISPAVARSVEYLNVRIGQFERADNHALDPGHLTAWARVDPDGRRDTVVVTLCVDRLIEDPEGGEDLLEAHPGAYAGSVYIDDPRVSGGAVTYRLNLQFQEVWQVLLAAVLSGLLGFVVGVALASKLSLRELGKNPVRAGTAFVAAVGAVGTVINAQYLTDPSWQGGFTLGLSFVATCAVAAYTAANVAGGIPTSGQPDGGGAAPAGGAGAAVGGPGAPGGGAVPAGGGAQN